MSAASSPSWLDSTDRFRDPVGAARMAQFIDLLGRFPTGHLVDLGSGHGIFARIAVGMGWRVTAVDVRDERFPDDHDIEWVVSDVRDFDRYDDVDVVACLGLWYHLALDDQIALAKAIAPRPLILDTHVAVDHQSNRFAGELTAITASQGYRGRLYDESALQAQATASWGNLSSFWPTVSSLGQQMFDAGYDVFEQVSPAHNSDRTFFVARAFPPELVAGLDERVKPYNAILKPDAPLSTRPRHNLTPQLELPRTAPAKPAPRRAAEPPTLPIRTATTQFVRAARASGRRKIGQAKRAAAGRRAR